MGSEIDQWSDDGIVMRLPEVDRLPPMSCCLTPMRSMTVILLIRRCSPLSRVFRPGTVAAVVGPISARRCGSNAGRRSAQLAAKYPTFPMLLEATRECVNDVLTRQRCVR